GVNLFFSISGFLITEILINQKLAGNFSVKNFLFRRILRIFPLYYLFLFIVLFFAILHIIPVNKLHFLSSLCYVSNFLPTKNISTILGHTWSLAVEEHFYLLWPCLVLKLNKKTLLKIIVLGITICVISYFIIYNHSSSNSFQYYQFTIPAILPIFFGSLLAYIKNYYSPQVFKKIFFGLNFLIPTFVFFILIFIPQIDFIFYPFFNSIIYFFVIGYIISYQNSTFVNLIENPILSYIGKISYGLYIWQGLFIGSGSSLSIVIFNYHISKFPINIFFTLIFSVLSFHFFEKRFLLLKDKYFSNK
ncbi:MAG: acyltransferase family protein, partial [Bacteroidota bacterium]